MSAGRQRAEELQREVKRQMRREEVGGGGERGGEGGEKGDVDDKEDEGEHYCFSVPVF